MAIIQESLKNGALVRHYSDAGMMIRQVETGIEYSEAVDVAPVRYTYEETDTPIDESTSTGEITNSQILDIITGSSAISTTQDAVAFRNLVEIGSLSIDDKTVSTAPAVLPKMSYNGDLIKTGFRINWNGTIKRATIDLNDTKLNNPDNAPNLWEDVLYKAGIRIIPEIITAGLAFAKGEQGWWGDVLYESLIDSNVYTPEAYPQGWQLVQTDF